MGIASEYIRLHGAHGLLNCESIFSSQGPLKIRRCRCVSHTYCSTHTNGL